MNKTQILEILDIAFIFFISVLMLPFVLGLLTVALISTADCLIALFEELFKTRNQ